MLGFSAAMIAGRKIGLLGGSFNPAHEGHLAISLEALKTLGLDRVVWLVSPQNPLKSASELADYEARLRSAREAAHHPRIAVSDFERRANLRYTIDTVRALKRRHPAARLVLLIGADNLLQLPRWRAWTRIFSSIPIAVFARPGWDRRALAGKAAQRFRAARLPLARARTLAGKQPPAWVFIPHTQEVASASAIRAAGEWP